MKKKNLKKTKFLISIVTVFIVASILGYYFLDKDKTRFDDSPKYHVKGIDVSHHNPILDWREVNSQNIAFAYIKATEGVTHNDRNYGYNYKLAKEAGVKVGSYHFYNFGISGYDQAKHFIDVASCQSGDLLPAIDVEHSSANPYSSDTAYINNTIKELTILEGELHQYYGLHPVIYTNQDCYKLYIKNRFPNNPIWISSLNNDPTEDIEKWVIWQFTHTGKLPTVVGDIDFNYFRYPIDRLNEIMLP
ncbi:MAG: hypothetical protein RL662_399 [Bacteroidota bacterium]|jgi:lysozyme